MTRGPLAAAPGRGGAVPGTLLLFPKEPMRKAVLLTLCAAVACAKTPASAVNPTAARPAAISADSVYDVSEATTVPSPMNVYILQQALERAYPPELKGSGAKVGPIVRFALDQSGHPYDIRVRKSSGYPAMDSTMVSAMARVRFTPARIGRTPVRVLLEMPLLYSPSH